MRTLIKNAEIFTLNSKDEIIRNGFVGVDGDKICYVGAQRPMEKAEKEIDGRRAPSRICKRAYTSSDVFAARCG